MALAEISAALGALKAATEMGRGIVAAGNAMEVATLRLQLADLVGALTDARLALADAQQRFDERDAEILRLRQALANQAQVVRRHNAYYEVGEDNQPRGDGYCMRCWEVEHKLYHLSYSTYLSQNTRCPSCRAEYDGNLSGPLD